jgi:flagellar biosynthesis regulator FlbT
MAGVDAYKKALNKTSSERDTEYRLLAQDTASLIEAFMDATTFAEVRRTLLHIVEDVNSKVYYRAMKTCKALIKYEDEMLKINNANVSDE